MPHSNNFNNVTAPKPVILLSPLDWGLGHTTRCIPLVHELLQQGCLVIIACNSTQKALLMQEFPQLEYMPLQGYDLQYGKKRWGTIAKIALQLPKILTRINNEKKWLNIFLQQRRVDMIISDNRFGFCAPNVYSVFITHQLYIKTGLGKRVDKFLQKLNYKKINRFNTCWVPDFKGRSALAGQLSNPAQLPQTPVHYLGCLSRLQPCTNAGQPIDLLIILSGPEPQRTLFEKQLLKDINQFAGTVVLVRGLPGGKSHIPGNEQLTVYNHAPVELLNQLLCRAGMVISRTGYTTVMDLLKLGKKSILVPTPGQAEQEYLATHLLQQQLAYTVPQNQFSLSTALQAANAFAYKQPAFSMDNYKKVIEEFIRAKP